MNIAADSNPRLNLDFFFQNKISARLILFIAGALYPLAFAPFEVWPLAFVSIIVLFITFLKSSVLSGFKAGFYWGLGCFGVGASWVYVSIHEFGFVPWLGAAALTLLFVVILALYKGLFGFLTEKLLKKTSPRIFVFIAPLAWLISEYIQSTLFNGFPWLLTGYSQIDSPLGTIATWLGVFGVSWMTVALCALVSNLILSVRSKPYWVSLVVLCGIVLLSNIHTGMTKKTRSNSTALDIALVQPNVSQLEKWDRKFFSKIVNIMFEQTETVWNADLIVWPEGAIPAYEHQVGDIVYDITKRAKANQSHLIMGIPSYDSEQKKSYVALNAYGEKSANYFKQVLVPFGEYVPLESWLRGAIAFLDLPMSGFTPADNQEPMSFDNFVAIPAICYEIAYPEIIRRLAVGQSDSPKLIVTVSNEAWFGDSFGPYQHMQMARMRALELGIALARSTNDGITGFVDARGNVIDILPRYQRSVLRKTIQLDNYATLYRQWGSFGVLSLLAISVFFIFLFLYLGRDKRL